MHRLGGRLVYSTKDDSASLGPQSRSLPLWANNNHGNKSVRQFHIVITFAKKIKSRVLG